MEPPGPMGMQRQPYTGLDDSTKYLLEKAKAARSRPMWEPEAPSYDQQPMQQPAPQSFERPDPYESRLQPRDPQDTMMSTKTRSLLDKVKESTAALQDMSTLDDFEESRTSKRKPSR